MTRRIRLFALPAVPILALIFASAACFSIAGCAKTPPAEPPGIVGTVTSVVPGNGGPASILVEGPAQAAGAVSDKASVTITSSTRVYGPDGRTADRSTIVLGATVKVWFTGPVAESYPVQGSAKAIQVTGASSR